MLPTALKKQQHTKKKKQMHVGCSKLHLQIEEMGCWGKDPI